MTSKNRSPNRAGIALVFISAIVFSTAGIFTKGVPADAWSVIFWRGLSAAAFTLIYTLISGTLRSELARFGRPALLVACLGAAGTAAFIPAFKLTSIANVAIIWAAAPFCAAALAWLAIGERPSRKTMIASLISTVGVAIVVSGSFGSGSLTGDLLALFMTLMMAALIVVYRIHPNTPTALPAALSSLLLLPPALVFATPLNLAKPDISILLAFGLIFAIASVTLSEGARRVPAGQTALIGALETPLAPLWAFLVLSEIPPLQTILGGGLIFAAVLWSQRS